VNTTHDPVQFWGFVAPDRPAIRHGDRAWTYGELDRAVQEMADTLLLQGLGAGEHIALEFEPRHSFEFTIALHALHRIGLLPVPISLSLPPEERQRRRTQAMVELVLTSESFEPALAGSKKKGKPKAPSALSEADAEDAGDALLARRLDAPAALCFTSGTTGVPRGAILTHGNFFWSALGSSRNLGVRACDTWLCCVPLHHVAGLSILTRSAAYGTAVLFHDSFDPNAVHEAIDRGEVTLLSLVPPMLERLVRTRGGRRFPTTLRAALIGGGPIPAALLEEAAELRLPALPTYGLTEAASQVTTLSLRQWPAGLATAGRPLPFVRVEIRAESGAVAGPEVEGEILVRGPTVMAAYFEDRESNATAWDGPWLKTGDVGAWDAAGRLVVLDRRLDRIVVGGENVSPVEVERVLARHPAVAEVCVVGIPAGAWGHEIAAAVTLRPGCDVTLEELRSFGTSSLAPFQLPRRIRVMELPRSPSGKLLRRAVRDLFREEMAHEEPA
jgi:o-succinylbenzoate---CoA ligase